MNIGKYHSTPICLIYRSPWFPLSIRFDVLHTPYFLLLAIQELSIPSHLTSGTVSDPILPPKPLLVTQYVRIGCDPHELPTDI